MTYTGQFFESKYCNTFWCDLIGGRVCASWWCPAFGLPLQPGGGHRVRAYASRYTPGENRTWTPKRPAAVAARTSPTFVRSAYVTTITRRRRPFLLRLLLFLLRRVPLPPHQGADSGAHFLRRSFFLFYGQGRLRCWSSPTATGPAAIGGSYVAYSCFPTCTEVIQRIETK